MNRRLWYAVLGTVALLSAASGAFSSSLISDAVGPYLLRVAAKMRLPAVAYPWIGLAALLGLVGYRKLRYSWAGRRAFVRLMAWRGRTLASIARSNHMSIDAVEMLLDRSPGKRDRNGREGFSGHQRQTQTQPDLQPNTH